MKKSLILLLIIVIIIGLGIFAFVNISKKVNEVGETLNVIGDTNSKTEEVNNETPSSEETSSQGETTSESMKWPSVIPNDIPKLENVTIEGYYPQKSGEKDYAVNFTIEKENASIIEAYVASLESAGYTKKYKTENNFGVDYSYNNDKYSIFINVVYGNSSKIGINIK